MVGTKARWYAPTAPARADPPVRGKPIYPGLLDGDKKRRGREKRRERQPQRKPGGAPSYKPYDYPTRPRRKPVPESPMPEAPARPFRTVRPSRITLGRLYAGFAVVDAVDQLLYPMPGLPPMLPSNWYWCTGPGPMPLVNWYNAPYFRAFGSCAQSVPLLAQAPGPGVGTPLPNRANRERYWWRDYLTPGGITRGAVVGNVRSTGASAAQPLPVSVDLSPAHGGSPDANAQRWAPGDAVGEPRPFVLGTGAAVSPRSFANSDLAYQPDYQWMWSPGVGLVDFGPPSVPGPTGPVTLRPPRPGRPPSEPVRREPPREREKQRKAVTKTAKIGIALFRALDAASESAEIVDAIYDALPEDVKKRWWRPDRQGDNFGQYGLGGADWKLQALYYNWHRVDVVQAIKNIIKNELTDQTIGRIQAGLPVNTGQAFSQGEREFAQLLDEWFADEFGL